MSRIDPTSNPPSIAAPAESTPVAPLPAVQPVPPEHSSYAGTPSRDFGRAKALAAAGLEGDDPALKKRKKRRGCFRKKLTLKRLRGKAHPAAADERYQRVFPCRAQDDQLHVCAELADPADKAKVGPGLRLADVVIEDDAGMIRRDIKAGLLVQYGNQADLPRGIVDERYRMLLQNLRAALEKTMQGVRPVPPEEVYVRELDDSDLAAGESALRGQYGLFNRRNAAGRWRTAAEGFPLCFFSGFLCRNATQYQAECDRYSREEVAAYALMISEADYPCVSPYGGGDLGQFANAAVKRDWRGRLVEDPARNNARFACATAIFEDNRPGGAGRLLRYAVVFLYMLEGRVPDDVFEREVRVSYGQPYWDGIDAMDDT